MACSVVQLFLFGTLQRSLEPSTTLFVLDKVVQITAQQRCLINRDLMFVAFSFTTTPVAEAFSEKVQALEVPVTFHLFAALEFDGPQLPNLF